METIEAPQIKNLKEITPDEAAAYVKFVAQVRHTQRRYFATRNPQVLERSRELEGMLDKLNAELLDPQPRLF